MDLNFLNQVVDNLQRQYGVIPPIQPAYQIHPQNFISNSSPSHFIILLPLTREIHLIILQLHTIAFLAHTLPPTQIPLPWKWNN